jgi:prefoldin subunit 5
MRAGVVALAAAGSAYAVTPVQKVIQLLEGMHKAGLAEKQEEEVKHSAYAQWCGDTASHKGKAIEKASRKIDRLAAEIQKANTDAAAAGAEIASLEEDIGHWSGDMKAAKEVRDRENVDFQTTSADYGESLSALDRAISTLQQQNFDRSQASLLQVSLKTASKTGSKFRMLAEVSSALRNFLSANQHPDAALSAPEAHGYEFQSGGVVDMLKQLKEKFEDENKNLETDETNAKHAYEQLLQVLHDNTENAQAVIDRRSQFKGQREADAAEATGEKADTQASKDADSKYLSDLNAQCSMKQQAFDERQKLREEELDAITQATDILASGDVSGAADKHLPALIQKSKARSFIQVKSRSTSPIQAKLAEFLQSRSQKFQSTVLSMLATRVAADPFKKVKKMISNMISKLMEEATAETEHKGWCDAELGQNKITREEKTANVEELNAEIEDLNATVAKLTQEVAELNAAVNDMDKARKEATEIRTAENKKNTIAIADAKAAQKAVANALVILQDFYAKAAGASSLAQLNSHAKSPAEDAPESFTEPYQGMQGENGGVVGMLEVIQTDFARLESETSASELQAASEYKTFMNDTELDTAVKQTDIEHKNSLIARKNAALVEANTDLKTTQGELSAANDYYDKLKPSCVDSGITYEERVARREAEIQSLQEALQMIEGVAE